MESVFKMSKECLVTCKQFVPACMVLQAQTEEDAHVHTTDKGAVCLLDDKAVLKLQQDESMPAWLPQRQQPG